VAKWNPLALKILLWVMGVLLVVGSAASFVGNAVFDFGSGAGVTAPVAGIAFGAGMMIAGFDPIANILVAVLVLVLYPNKPALWMQGQGGMSSGARA